MFSSPIVMVSAIDKATTVLLQNHTVCVFTGYGYNIVRFPLVEAFSDHHLTSVSMSTRYEAPETRFNTSPRVAKRLLRSLAAGTFSPWDSTTRSTQTWRQLRPPTLPSSRERSPSPNAYGMPERMVCGPLVSASMAPSSSAQNQVLSGGEIQRVKAKDSYLGGAEVKRKDFKFQRVPYTTKVATVRASTFGAFAAIRKDSTVMKEQIGIEEQSLWADISSLNSLSGFKASGAGTEAGTMASIGDIEVMRERLGPVACEILISSDLDRDLESHLENWKYGNDPLDVAVCTSTAPDLKVPIHGWVLSRQEFGPPCCARPIPQRRAL